LVYLCFELERGDKDGDRDDIERLEAQIDPLRQPQPCLNAWKTAIYQQGSTAMKMTDLSQLKVLLVDDDDFVLDLLTATLNGIEVTNVTTASEGQRALHLVDEQAVGFDVILCDLNMPKLDGVELLRHLANRNFTGGIILFSGEGQRILNTARDLANAHRLSVLGALEKPVTGDALAELLGRLETKSTRQQPQSGSDVAVEELRRAIEGGQLVLHYQPKVMTTSRKVVGAEALVRWAHPEKGIIPPVAFIRLAEENGLIDALTETVYGMAMKQGGIWQASAQALKLSVNLSMDNLEWLDLPDYLALTAGSYGMDLENVIVEITECRLMRNMTLSLEILARLRLMGIELSIDDFGTGNSSMEQLQTLPLTELKIDRAFVTGAATDRAARTILESSVDLARKLGLSIVAEGVETEQDWELVAEMGCDQVQGYFVARPMPAAEFETWRVGWEN